MSIRTRLTRSLAAIGLLAGLVAGSAGVAELALDGPGPAPAVAAPVQPVDPAPVVLAPPAAPAVITAPTRFEVPAIGVDEDLTGRGLQADGSLDTPDYGDASWYRPGPRPGEPGGAVIVAHVHGPDGPDVFWDLAKLEPGDTIRVHRPGAMAVFVVDSVEDVPKEALPYDEIWPSTAEPLLRLITCGGKRLPQGGYPDNTVVYAHLAATQPIT